MTSAIAISEPVAAQCTHSGTNLNYCGGVLLKTDTKIVPVYWGPNVAQTTLNNATNAYVSISNSNYFQWLNEYSAPGFTVGGASVFNNTGFTITPHTAKQNLDDSGNQQDIFQELVAQFTTFPPPLPRPFFDIGLDTVYLIHLPPGATVVPAGGGQAFCANEAAQGYHASRSWNGGATNGNIPVYYAVVCDANFASVMAEASHELAEAITDPESLAATGWVAANKQEIGDKCEELFHQVVDPQGGTSNPVQYLWDNALANAGGYVTGETIQTALNDTRSGCFAQKARQIRAESMHGAFNANQSFLAAPFVVGTSFRLSDVAVAYGDSSGNIGIDVHENQSLHGGPVSFAQKNWTSPGTQGAFFTDEAFMSGDFDGDGFPDIADGWNNGGWIALDVHRNTKNHGFEFHSQAGAAPNHGLWSDSWYWAAGDFNGDGKDDIAVIWSLLGTTTIDLHFATGNLSGTDTGFVIAVRAATDQGNFSSGQHWFAGDVDNDGKMDLINVRNDNGKNAIDVHFNTGNCPANSTSCNGQAFTLLRQVGAAGIHGNYDPTMGWMAADFNGDGRVDLANAFNDSVTPGLIDIDVHLSVCNPLAGHCAVPMIMQRWATRQNGWPAGQKWFAGRFNSANLTQPDFGLAFGDGSGSNLSLDVHLQQ